MEGTPLGDVHGVTWPWQGRLGGLLRTALEPQEVFAGEDRRTRGLIQKKKSSNTPWEPFLLEKGRKTKKTDFGYIIRVQFIY